MFELGLRPLMAMLLDSVVFARLPRIPVADRPLLVLPNHVSWWDGFLVRRLQQRVRPHGRLYSIMLEQELRKAPFLRRLGAIGMSPGSLPSVRRMFRVIREVARENPEAVVQFYPQGRIYPSFRRPLGLEPGFERLMSVLDGPLVLPVALHIEPLNRLRPTAFVVCGSLLDPTRDPVDRDAVEAEITGRLDWLQALLGRHGERVIEALNAPTDAPARTTAHHPPDKTAPLTAVHRGGQP
jgi:1-acyl-sn-glycerol-3-phosphate acyltransferase